MQCVYYGDRLPNGFEERFFFSPQMPYTICIKEFQMEDIVPLHYADTIELLLCENLCGEIVIDNQRFALEGEQLFVIPPYTLHSNNIRPGGGTMHVFKICFQEMDRYFNVQNYLALKDLSLSQAQYLCPAYAEVKAIVQRLIALDGDLMACLPLIMELFLELSRHMNRSQSGVSTYARFKSSSLQELIRWTNENYNRKIAIEEVAKMAGYSKYYFCSLFRQATGMSYMTYLKSVRIFHACLLLQKGEPVQSVAAAVGFCDAAHFIQVFKQEQGLSPRRYALQYPSPAAGAEPEDCGTTR